MLFKTFELEYQEDSCIFGEGVQSLEIKKTFI